MRTFRTVVLLVLVGAACSGGQSESAPATEPQTTPPATEPPVSTTAPSDTVTGVVWESAVDASRVNQSEPPPTWSSGGVIVTLQMLLQLPAGHESCPGVSPCLLTQYAFNVADDAQLLDIADSVQVAAEDAVTAEGLQIECDFGLSSCFTDAFPGTVDNWMSALYTGAGPNATLRFSIIGISANNGPFVIDVPGADRFQTLNFDV